MPDANPVFDLGDPIWIAVVAVAETPPELAGYAGRYLSVPNGTALPPLGTRGVVHVSGVNVPGYLRQSGGEFQWVMLPAVDPLDAVVDAVPGPQGWSDLGARETWRGIARALSGYGVSLPDLGPGLHALYDAARTNLLKEYGVA